MQFAAHANDRPPAECYGRGETVQAAIISAKMQFVGAPKYWPAVRDRLVTTEVPDDFRGKWA